MSAAPKKQNNSYTTSNGTTYTKVGSLRRSVDEKTGSVSEYLKFEAPLNLKEGTTLTLKDPRDSWKKMVESGKMTEDQLQEKLDSMEWLRREIYVVSKGK